MARRSYESTLRWLYHLEVSRDWDLKLESVRAALELFGHPEREFPSIHVAGTNGKGSTAAFAHALLGAAGLRTGLYTSPHLVDFTERIRIGDEPIVRDEVVRLVHDIHAKASAAGVDLTFFELTTVLAFRAFAEAPVDAAVIEVGLGGRLDATNVIEPRVSVVTTIGLDHQRYLGSTETEIAREKGGILKPGVPAVLGQIRGEAEAVLENIATERGCPLVRFGRDFRVVTEGETFAFRGERTIRGLRVGNDGAFQRDNAAVAIAAVGATGWLDELSDESVRQALLSATWPGRLEVLGRKPTILLDGAHNPSAVRALATEIPRIAGSRRVRLLFGVLGDRDVRQMAEILAPLVTDATVVPVQERRSADPEEMASAFRPHVPTAVAPSGRAGLARLREEEEGRDTVIVVAGSLFLVGEVRGSIEPELLGHRGK